MDWLLEFEGLIVPVTLILLYLLQRVFTRDEGEQAPGRGLGDAPSAAEEKARQIREEIRRKIVARQQGREAPREVEPPAFFEEDKPAPGRAFEPFPRRAEPPPLVEEPFPAAPPIFPHYEVRPPTPPPPPEPERLRPSADGNDIMEELRRQRERLEQAREAKKAAERETRPSRKRPVRAGRSAARSGSLREQLQADLAETSSLKRAFLLKEIVDRPTGIRPEADKFSNY